MSRTAFRRADGGDLLQSAQRASLVGTDSASASWGT
jgi:hypothetical protein